MAILFLSTALGSACSKRVRDASRNPGSTGPGETAAGAAAPESPFSLEARLRKAAVLLRQGNAALERDDRALARASIEEAGSQVPGCFPPGTILREAAVRALDRKDQTAASAGAILWILSELSRVGAEDPALKTRAVETLARFVPALATRDQLIGLRLALEAYRVDLNRFPLAADAPSLFRQIVPTYLSEAHASSWGRDAWGTDLRIVVRGDDYQIVSAGADRLFDPESWARPGVDLQSTEDAVATERGLERIWAVEIPVAEARGAASTGAQAMARDPHDVRELAADQIAAARSALRRLDAPSARLAFARASERLGCRLETETAQVTLEVSRELLANGKKTPASLRAVIGYLQEVPSRFTSTSGILEAREMRRTAMLEEARVAPVASTLRAMRLLGGLEQAWRIDYPDGPSTYTAPGGLEAFLLARADADGFVHVTSDLYLPVRYLARDAWGTPFELRVDAGAVCVVSAGTDHQLDPGTWSKQEWNLPTSADAVYRHDRFLRSWRVED